MGKNHRLSRRMLLGGGVGVAGLASNLLALWASPQGEQSVAYASSDVLSQLTPTSGKLTDMSDMAQKAALATPTAGVPSSLPFMNGDVDPKVNGFDPALVATTFDPGKVTQTGGQTLREYVITAINKNILVAPGVAYPAWTYNGTVPGPTIRCTEGDRIRVTFINRTAFPHSIHFHGIHPIPADGSNPMVPLNGQIVYEFEASPVGLHLYHCHAAPLTFHMSRGLYGAFIIDPKGGRTKAKEMVMVMNAFPVRKPTSLSGPNDVYAFNTVAFHYVKHPIPVKVNELIRFYVINAVEFDHSNSFHLHANLFNLYRTGTKAQADEFTDLVIMSQAERHVMEFMFPFPGPFFFHTHLSGPSELGQVGLFNVTL